MEKLRRKTRCKHDWREVGTRKVKYSPHRERASGMDAFWCRKCGALKTEGYADNYYYPKGVRFR